MQHRLANQLDAARVVNNVEVLEIVPTRGIDPFRKTLERPTEPIEQRPERAPSAATARAPRPLSQDCTQVPSFGNLVQDAKPDHVVGVVVWHTVSEE